MPQSFVLSIFLGLSVISPSWAQSPVGSPTTESPAVPSASPADRSATPALPAPNRSDRSSYLLGAGDAVQITVFGYEEFTGTRPVLPDGSVTLPMVGGIQAQGRTTDELAQEITVRLQDLLVDPVVTIGLITLRPVVVNVSGEVLRPGPVQLRSLTDTTADDSNLTAPALPTMSRAIGEAGGITQVADIREVTLKRQSPDGTAQTTTVNLWDAISSDNPPPDLVLQDGDAIYIPRLAANAQLDRRRVAQSSFAPETIRVRVVGEVNQPGEVQVPPNSSISSAVAIAGGPTDDARLSKVAFVRMDENGQIERQEVDLDNLTDTFQVQDGDVVIVPKRGTSSLLDFAGRLFSPLGVILNLFQ